MMATDVHTPSALCQVAARRLWMWVLAGAMGGDVVPVFAAEATAIGVGQSANVQLLDIDFRKTKNQSGRVILKFDHKGAVLDLHQEDGKVIVDLPNASMPGLVHRAIDVADFSTPVQRIDAYAVDKASRLIINTRGRVDATAYQDQDQYAVEISAMPDHTAVNTRVPRPTQLVQSDGVETKTYHGKPLTFNFQDIPVRTVLQLIAEESKLNLVASDTVQGNVTLRLLNVPWDQALEIVLRAKGLDKRRDGNVVWVAPQAELAKFEQDKEDARIAIESRQDLITDYLQINYHSASEIYKALTEAKGTGGQHSAGAGNVGGQENGFLSGRGRLVADARTNTLMISDIPKKVAAMRELIGVIDRPVDQVLIEARIVVAVETFARDLGAKFGLGGTHTYSGGNVATIGSGVTGGGAAATRGLNVNLPANSFTNGASGGAPSLAYTLLGANFNLDLELSALQEEGRGEVISHPRIITANQREGDIKQGTEIGYVTITGDNSRNGATPNVQFKEALLQLKVTPTITHDGRVFLNMVVKKDDVAELISLAGYGTVPTLNRREINTAVLIEDGQTVVIGGVYEFTDRSSVSKVPWLGDIPFLGNLFKKQGKEKDKAELLIFVTPKVISVRQ